MILQSENLCLKKRAKLLLDDINFCVNPGDRIALMGLNGAGKSSLLKILAGLQLPSSGSLQVNCNNIAYLAQNPALHQDVSVEDFLGLFAKLQYAKHDDLTRLDAVIAQCDLHTYRHTLIAELSQGYQRRVALAQALLGEPDVLLLDEPCNGLDPMSSLQIREHIKKLKSDKALILATHLMADVLSLCNRVIILAAGKIVLNAPLSELISETAAFSHEKALHKASFALENILLRIFKDEVPENVEPM